jgi:hypothetical protein
MMLPEERKLRLLLNDSLSESLQLHRELAAQFAELLLIVDDWDARAKLQARMVLTRVAVDASNEELKRLWRLLMQCKRTS